MDELRGTYPALIENIFASASGALALTIKTTAPAPANLALSGGGASTDNLRPTISGTGEAGDTLILYDGATIVGTTTVAGNGSWSLVTAQLAVGAHTLTASETDVAANTSAASTGLGLAILGVAPPAALTLAPGSDSGVQGDNITNVVTPVITGSGIAGVPGPVVLVSARGPSTFSCNSSVMFFPVIFSSARPRIT